LSQGGTRHYRTAPTAWAVEPLAVVNLGCEQHPIYHGGGLLPGLLDRGTRVLTPCVYAPWGKWAVRPLTYLKALLCKDVFETLAKVLVTFPPVSDKLLRGFVPGKCLVVGSQALFHDWNGGGTNSDKCEAGKVSFGAGHSGSTGRGDLIDRAPLFGSNNASSCKEALL
jgi:hypothetical protein